MMESFGNKEPLFSGEQKVNEYIERIKGGESKDLILEGLPPSFRSAIEKGIQGEEPSQEEEKENIQNKEAYTKFSVKSGESNGGFFWYEYRNKKAKELKESGEFKWGEERIYFDIKTEDCEKLRDIIFEIAGENKIPIGFKYLDDEKTVASNKDGSETRFVANFASLDDSKRFYKLLAESPEYQAFTPDRTLDYNGIRIDNLAEYAGGYRETRGALGRIMQAKKIEQDIWEFISESGKPLRISDKEYEAFKAKYDSMTAKFDQARAEWDALLAKE